LLTEYFTGSGTFVPQEKKLMEEIQRLNDEMRGCDENIQSRKANITTLESLIAMSRERFSDYKVERDSLQDKKKFVYLVFSVMHTHVFDLIVNEILLMV
jgi:chromosome segregation ATPase